MRERAGGRWASLFSDSASPTAYARRSDSDASRNCDELPARFSKLNKSRMKRETDRPMSAAIKSPLKSEFNSFALNSDASKRRQALRKRLGLVEIRCWRCEKSFMLISLCSPWRSTTSKSAAMTKEQIRSSEIEAQARSTSS